jgi:hypothetical protein
MTTDATARHSEHRIRVCGDVALTERFSADFDTIWNRLRPLEARPERESGDAPGMEVDIVDKDGEEPRPALR